MGRRRSGWKRLGAAAAVLIAGVVGRMTPADAHKPLPAPILVSMTLSRTTAASGQAILATGSGCATWHEVNVELFVGTTSNVTDGYPVAVGWAQPDPDGTYEVELPLLANVSNGQDAPLPEGQYTAVAWCGDPLQDRYIQSDLQTVTIAGAKPSGDIAVDRTPDRRDFTVVGGSCDQPSVQVRYQYTMQGSGKAKYRTVAATPGPDGAWGSPWDGPAGAQYLYVFARCGDPVDAGFLYATKYVALHVDPPTSTTSSTTSSSTTTSTTIPDGDAGAAQPVMGTPSYAG